MEEIELLQGILCSRPTAVTPVVFNKERAILWRLLRRAAGCTRIRQTLMKFLSDHCSQREYQQLHGGWRTKEEQKKEAKEAVCDEFLDKLRAQLLRIRVVSLLKQDFVLAKELAVLESLCHDVCNKQDLPHVFRDLWEVVGQPLTKPSDDRSSSSQGRVMCTLSMDAAIISRASQILESAVPAEGCAHCIIDLHAYHRPLFDRPFENQTSSTIGQGQVDPSVCRACLAGCSSNQFVPETTSSTYLCCPYSTVDHNGHHPATVTAGPEINAADALPLLTLAEAVGATAVVDGCLNLIATAEEAVVDAARKMFGDATGVVDWARAVGRLARWPRKTTQRSSPQCSLVPPPAKPRSVGGGKRDSCKGVWTSCSEGEDYNHCDRDSVGGVQHGADDGGSRTDERGGKAALVRGCNGENSGHNEVMSGRRNRACFGRRYGFSPPDVGTNVETIENTSHKTDTSRLNEPVADDSISDKGGDGGIMTRCSERTQTMHHESDEKIMTTDGLHPRALVPSPPPSPFTLTPHSRKSGVICHENRNMAKIDGEFKNTRVRTAARSKTNPAERSNLDKARDEQACNQRWCRWATAPTPPRVSVEHRGAQVYCEAEATAAKGKQASESGGNRGDDCCENDLNSPYSLSSATRGQGAARRGDFSPTLMAGIRSDGNRCNERVADQINFCPSAPVESSLNPPENSFSHALPSSGVIGKSTQDDVTLTGAASARRRFLEVGGIECNDGNAAVQKFSGRPKPWPPDKAVAAMLVVREDERLCAQARKRALQRLRQARRQQEVKRAEASAGEQELRIERYRKREKNVAKILTGRRRGGGSDAAKRLAGCWSEGEQYFGDRISVDGIHREESRPRKVTFSSITGLRGHLPDDDDDDNGDDDDRRFYGDVSTSRTWLSTSSCTGARGERIAALERCRSRTEEEETAREPLLVTPVEPGPSKSFTRRAGSRSMIHKKRGCCGGAVSADDIPTGCLVRERRCPGKTGGTRGDGHGTVHQKTQVKRAVSTATIDETSSMGSSEKSTIVQSRQLCQSCRDGEHFTSAASPKLILRLDTLCALPDRQQYFARRGDGGGGGGGTSDGGGGGDYTDWCDQNDEGPRSVNMGELYLVLQVGQIRHQTAAQHPEPERPTRSRRQQVDGGGARWTFGETVVLNLSRATTTGEPAAAPALRILAYKKRDGRIPTDRSPAMKCVDGSSSSDADRRPVVGAAAEDAGFDVEDVLVGSASLFLKDSVAPDGGASEECTFQHPLEIPLLSIFEGVAIGWLMLSMCGSRRWSAV